MEARKKTQRTLYTLNITMHIWSLCYTKRKASLAQLPFAVKRRKVEGGESREEEQDAEIIGDLGVRPGEEI